MPNYANKIRSFIANAALTLGSVGFVYLITELLLFPAFLPVVPLKFQEYLGDLYTLGQSSKEGVSPKNYIALVGDSYAQGSGDWLITADPDRNGPFHSAHVIHETTGQDVISFGRGGAGSIDGDMILPIRKFRRINSTWLYHLDPPNTLIVYFYEGNDLNNNLGAMNEYIKFPSIDEPDRNQALETFINEQYDEAAASTTPLSGNAFALNFFWKLAKERFRGITQIGSSGQSAGLDWVNKVRVAGTVVSIPDKLQSPAMELNEDEISITVQVFELALARLHRFFPGARLIVTIIPSPLSSYDLASKMVVIQNYENRAALYFAAKVEERSNQICELVAAASLRVGAEFVDVRGEIRSLARKELIHGPQDWKHFNKQGYTVLGKTLSAYLQTKEKTPSRCVSLKTPGLAAN
jgi:hypothetical protein